jgi:hypothetical protein
MMWWGGRRGHPAVVILSEAREAGVVEGPLSARIGKRSFDYATAAPSLRSG